MSVFYDNISAPPTSECIRLNKLLVEQGIGNKILICYHYWASLLYLLWTGQSDLDDWDFSYLLLTLSAGHFSFISWLNNSALPGKHIQTKQCYSQENIQITSAQYLRILTIDKGSCLQRKICLCCNNWIVEHCESSSAVSWDLDCWLLVQHSTDAALDKKELFDCLHSSDLVEQILEKKNQCCIC